MDYGLASLAPVTSHYGQCYRVRRRLYENDVKTIGTKSYKWKEIFPDSPSVYAKTISTRKLSKTIYRHIDKVETVEDDTETIRHRVS